MVLFAGAGTSVDKPTALPNFTGLVKEITEYTGKTFNEEPCEVFLGALKAGGIDVKWIAVHILSDTYDVLRVYDGLAMFHAIGGVSQDYLGLNNAEQVVFEQAHNLQDALNIAI